MRFASILLFGTVGLLITGGGEPDCGGEVQALRMELSAALDELRSSQLEIVRLEEALTDCLKGWGPFGKMAPPQRTNGHPVYKWKKARLWQVWMEEASCTLCKWHSDATMCARSELWRPSFYDVRQECQHSSIASEDWHGESDRRLFGWPCGGRWKSRVAQLDAARADSLEAQQHAELWFRFASRLATRKCDQWAATVRELGSRALPVGLAPGRSGVGAGDEGARRTS